MQRIDKYYSLVWKTSVSSGVRKFNISNPKHLEHIEMWKERYKKAGVSFILKKTTITTEIQEIEEYVHEKRK